MALFFNSPHVQLVPVFWRQLFQFNSNMFTRVLSHQITEKRCNFQVVNFEWKNHIFNCAGTFQPLASLEITFTRAIIILLGYVRMPTPNMKLLFLFIQTLKASISQYILNYTPWARFTRLSEKIAWLSMSNLIGFENRNYCLSISDLCKDTWF